MDFKIVHLPKEKWKGQIIPISYTTEQYFDVSIEKKAEGFTVHMEKKEFDTPVSHTPEEYDFPDKLYEEWWEDACAWGVLVKGELAAAIETAPEKWSNRLRITELWVAPEYQKQGIGHALMEVAKEQARLERRRAIMLETQSCNANAVGFYLHEGFTLIGFDSCCYANNDLQRKEVRLELGILKEKKKRLSRENVEIRKETAEDEKAVERVAQEAFWNRHRQGCHEHYLVHRLRESSDYLPELSRIAAVDGEVVGTIMYSKARIEGEGQTQEIVSFGPLCVKPSWQGTGIGEMLLRETMQLAKEAGYPGIVIFGEPDYYPRIGFQTCDKFGVTTSEGKNFDAFMGIELQPDEKKLLRGKFYKAEVFEQLDKEGVEAFHKEFEPLEKQYFPCQWKAGG